MFKPYVIWLKSIPAIVDILVIHIIRELRRDEVSCHEYDVYFLAGSIPVHALTMNKKYPYPPRPQFSWLPRVGIMGATLSSSFAGENLLDWMKLD